MNPAPSSSAIAFVLTTLTACNEGAKDAALSDEPLELSATYDPTSALRLELDDGATLELPAAASAEAGTLSFSRVTCGGAYAAPELPGCLYRVETDLDLSERFTLTLPRESELPGAVVERAEDGLLALLDSSEGLPLTSTATPSTMATASIATDFTVRDTRMAPPDMRCVDLDFSPCGGSLTGHWELSAACGTKAQVTGSSSSRYAPYDSCDETEHIDDYPLQVWGDIDFNEDGGSWSSRSYRVLRHTITTLSCLESVGETCLPTCTTIDDVCICLDEWASGSTGSSWPSTAEAYEDHTCVDGDTLTIELESIFGTYWLVYERG